MMRIVIDTNVLLASLPKVSHYRAIITALTEGKVDLAVLTAILLEYQEVLSSKTNNTVATNFLEFLTKLPGLIRVDTPFSWGIIEIDPDDNKFVDAGLMAGADYIITFDGHFNVVKSHPFPSIGIINPDDFLILLATDYFSQ